MTTTKDSIPLLNETASELLRQAEAGEIVILQKRITEGVYEYRKYKYRTKPSSRSNARPRRVVKAVAVNQPVAPVEEAAEVSPI